MAALPMAGWQRRNGLRIMVVMRFLSRTVALLTSLALISLACARTSGDTAPESESERAIVGAADLEPEVAELEIDRLAVRSPDQLRSSALAHITDGNPRVHARALYALSL